MPLKSKKLSGNKLGRGIAIEIDGDMVTLKFDMSKSIGKSKSGKTTLIASSGGNVEIATGVKLGLNCYRDE
jgi:hypothetical protein